MWFEDDPLADLSGEALEALVQAEMTGRGVGVSLPEPKLPKLRSGPKGVLKKLPGEVPDHSRPNDTVFVTIGLPAYLVIGCSEIGGVEAVAREGIRERLKREGIKWWYPRFLMRTEL